MALSSLIINLRANTSQFDRGMRKSRGKISSFQYQVQKTARSLRNMFAGVSVVYGFTKIVRATADFEKQMAMVSTMLDEQTMNYMPAYTRALRSMSIEFGESTATLSKGLYDILSASVAPAEAIQVLSASVKAAKAGFTDTAVAADVITTILNAYSMPASKATEVSDKLFAIVKKGKTTFAELGASMGKVVSIASVAGLSLDEVGAVLAKMTRAGLQTEIATTSLRSVLNAFLKPTDAAKKAAAEFGLELNINTLQAIGLTGALKKLTQANAEQLAQIIPNTRGLAGFASALKQVGGETNDLEYITNSAGRTQEAYDKSTGTLAHSLSQLKQSFVDAGVSIGEQLIPALQSLSEQLIQIAENADKVGNFFSGIGSYIKTWTTAEIKGMSWLGSKMIDFTNWAQKFSLIKRPKWLQSLVDTVETYVDAIHKVSSEANRSALKKLTEIAFGIKPSKPKIPAIPESKTTTPKTAETISKAAETMSQFELDRQQRIIEAGIRRTSKLVDVANTLKQTLKSPLDLLKDFKELLDELEHHDLLEPGQWGELFRRKYEELRGVSANTYQPEATSEAIRTKYIDVAGLNMGKDKQLSKMDLQLSEAKKQSGYLEKIANKESLG